MAKFIDQNHIVRSGYEIWFEYLRGINRVTGMSIAQIRQRAAKNFEDYYQSLCALESTTPVASVLAGAKLNTLKCNASQLRASDWHPLLSALQINKTFHTIAIYKKWEDVYLTRDVRTTGTRFRSNMYCKTEGRGPDRDMVSAIIRSLNECMCVSPALKCLMIEGISFRTKDIVLLSKGLSDSNVLSHLSLKGSRLGDKGVEIVCGVLKNLQCLGWLDLTACDIGPRGTTFLAALIKFQCTARQTAAWKGSLRRHQPSLADIQGLRRLTLNLNRSIGDRGALELSNALMDDKWIRALDLQSCDISTDGAIGFSEALRLNGFLVTLDLRDNELIDDDILDDINAHLASNAAHMTTDHYSQLDLEVERIASLSKPPVHLSLAIRKTKHIKSPAMQRIAKAPKLDARRISVRKCGVSKLYSAQRTLSLSSLNKSQKVLSKPKTHSTPLGGIDEASNDKILSTMKHLKVELLTCKRKLHEESVARSIAESRLLQVELENRKLTEQLNKVLEGYHHSLDASGTVMVNKDTIKVVEMAFQHFHRFMDTLHLTKNDTASGIHVDL